VGHHDGAGLGTDGLSQPIRDGVVGAELDVDDNGGQAVLNDRVDRRWEAGGNGQDLVAAFEGALAQFVAGQTAERDEVGARAAIDEQCAASADVLGKSAFKQRMEASGGQPTVQACIDQRCEVFCVEDLAGDRNDGFPRGELVGG
jgi:hypothetical protein